jgi:ABC-type nickel/cobalt efflux system permease component RcnA
MLVTPSYADPTVERQNADPTVVGSAENADAVFEPSLSFRDFATCLMEAVHGVGEELEQSPRLWAVFGAAFLLGFFHVVIEPLL